MRSRTSMMPHEIVAKFRDFMAWLEGARISVRGTRIEGIWSIISAFPAESVLARRDIRESPGAANWDSLQRICLCDAFTFVKIHEQLCCMGSHNIPFQAIRDAIRGPLDPSDEVPGSGSEHARNRQFELELASILAAGGHEVVRFDDVVLKVQGMLVGIQCKRVQKLRNLDSNFDGAVKQILARVPRKCDFGVVAVALDVIEGTHAFQAVALTGARFARETRDTISLYEHEIRRLLHRTIVPPVIGGVLFLRRFGRIEVMGATMVSRESAFMPRFKEGHLHDLFAALVQTPYETGPSGSGPISHIHHQALVQP